MYPPTVVIVGLGPGGLASAIEAARRGYKVVGLEKRDDYIRGQRLKLTPSTIAYLNHLVTTHHHILRNDTECVKERGLFSKLAEIHQDPDKTIETKDLERLLLAVLKCYPKNVSIFDGEITSVDMTRGIMAVDFKSKRFPGQIAHCRGVETLYFQSLIAADGAGRSTQKKMFPGMPDQIYPWQPYHKYHGVGNFQTDVSLQGLSIHPLTQADLPQLKALGWEHRWLPRFYVFPDLELKKFYIAGEVPACFDALNPAEKRVALQQWFNGLLALSYQTDRQRFKVREGSKKPGKDRMRLQMFTQSFSRTAVPYYTVNGRVHFFQTGDALQGPNYNFGHGANDAVNAALAFGTCLNAHPHHGYWVNVYNYIQHIYSVYCQFDKNMTREALRDGNNQLYDISRPAAPTPSWNPLQGFMSYQELKPSESDSQSPEFQSLLQKHTILSSEPSSSKSASGSSVALTPKPDRLPPRRVATSEVTKSGLPITIEAGETPTEGFSGTYSPASPAVKHTYPHGGTKNNRFGHNSLEYKGSTVKHPFILNDERLHRLKGDQLKHAILNGLQNYLNNRNSSLTINQRITRIEGSREYQILGTHQFTLNFFKQTSSRAALKAMFDCARKASSNNTGLVNKIKS